jgi:hypothetical protein
MSYKNGVIGIDYIGAPWIATPQNTLWSKSLINLLEILGQKK